MTIFVSLTGAKLFGKLVSHFLVLVDLTLPVEGTVKDGLTDESDIKYSSNPATVAASWQGFSDPESRLDTSQADVVRKLQGVLSVFNNKCFTLRLLS